jgi:pimeloyl-ACP methyl ester carboxylesterase
MAALGEAFTEQAVLLGERHSLVSVIARPRVARNIDLPAVVILNTGIVHRVGHHRMYVTLSRILAARGYTVVRFDQSGLGDSGPRSDHLPPLAGGLADIREVLDALEKAQQISRFILTGLCSGADQAVLYGHADPRVVGLIIMDPTIPPTPRYYLYYILRRMRQVQNWINFMSGRSGLVRMAAAHLRNRMWPQDRARPPTLQNLQFSPYLAQCYAATAARGMKILAAFTALSPRHAYERQILDAFPEVSAGGSLQLQYFPESDHLFSASSDRARLFRVIDAWLGVHWGG